MTDLIYRLEDELVQLLRDSITCLMKGDYDSSVQYLALMERRNVVEKQLICVTEQRQHQSLQQTEMSLPDQRQIVPFDTSKNSSFHPQWEDSAAEVQSRANCRVPAESFFHSTSANVSFQAIEDDAPACHCGQSSILLTSKKDASLNQQFYRCASDICKFFQWKNEDFATLRNPNNNSLRSMDLSTSYASSGGPNGLAVKDVDVELLKVFGHTGFRHGQRECIIAALNGQDVFCLMPTGGGKSIVYQVCLQDSNTSFNHGM